MARRVASCQKVMALLDKCKSQNAYTTWQQDYLGGIPHNLTPYSHVMAHWSTNRTQAVDTLWSNIHIN
uniref:Uncharacterized protein n=1 Tax=Rhizophora mucronata TaxID=61149 RepID=A0A2P2QZ70_RHIMU